MIELCDLEAEIAELQLESRALRCIDGTDEELDAAEVRINEIHATLSGAFGLYAERLMMIDSKKRTLIQREREEIIKTQNNRRYNPRAFYKERHRKNQQGFNQ